MANYLYNGEQFQDINSVYTDDLKKVYPFALIKTGMFSTAERHLYLFREDAYYFDNGTRYFGSNEDNPIPSCTSKYDANSGTWNELLYHDNGNVNVGGNTATFGDILWSNFDVLNEDGSVYLAASDPIPVNPAPTLDPTALLMGWQVGNRIRQGGGA